MNSGTKHDLDDPSTHAFWWTQTSNACFVLNEKLKAIYEARRKLWGYGSLSREGDELDRREEEAFVEYKRRILSAWRMHRPNGPLEGECLPNEVARLLGKGA